MSKSIGEQIIDAIVEGQLVSLECPDHPESACMAVWSANAAEQITAMIHGYERVRGTEVCDCCGELDVNCRRSVFWKGDLFCCYCSNEWYGGLVRKGEIRKASLAARREAEK